MLIVFHSQFGTKYEGIRKEMSSLIVNLIWYGLPEMATLDGNISLGRNYAELVGKFKVKLEGFCLCGGVLSADGFG